MRCFTCGFLLAGLTACDAPGSAECDTSQDPCESAAAWISACESFPTIQGALDAAVDGTTVHVCPGEHGESLHVATDNHPSQHIALEGEGSDTTTIQAAAFDHEQDNANVREGMVIYDDGVELSLAGLTLTGGTGYEWDPDTSGSDSFGGGLNLRFSQVALVDVRITGNTARMGGAIYAEASDVTMTSSAVCANTSDSGVVRLSGSSTLRSASSDWGCATDNTPADIEMEGPDDSDERFLFDFGSDATFTCAENACVED